jgi:hypothetical protein
MELLYSMFGVDRTIFIRPDGGSKSFTGQLFHKETFIKDLDNLRRPPEEIVVVSGPKDIDEEYRLVVGNGKYITGGQYKSKGKLQKAPESSVPQEAIDIAIVAANLYKPDPVYVIDIGMTYQGAKIVEINSFSCSGLYWCNLEKIVEQVSEIVYNDWREVYD